jgi:hypothetical protein
MGLSPFRKLILQPGPILSLTLIGILLLSAVIYYRANNVQRFLEPALALSEPRLKFSQNIRISFRRNLTQRNSRHQVQIRLHL